MSERKGLSKKLRFEVFKRDSFTCVYCGRSAPDVVLHVDHIVPVSKGGTDDLTNLVTSCADCNLGKSNHEINDKSVVMKQKRQLDELNERREQLELMKQWNDELNNIENETVEYASDLFQSLTGSNPSDAGKAKLKHCLKKYGAQAVIDGVKKSVDRNFKGNRDSAEISFNRIEREILYKIRERENPELNKILYIRGILKNRFKADYQQLNNAVKVMQDAVDDGVLSTDELKELALAEQTFDDWCYSVDYARYERKWRPEHESKKNR